ncbi:serine/threonine-protein kinase STY8-like protein [Tanacetum coccineum]
MLVGFWRETKVKPFGALDIPFGSGRGPLDPCFSVMVEFILAQRVCTPHFPNSGMNYLHHHKPHAIVHRDLTPRNVLQDEAGRLKVTDFGLSKIAQEKDVYGYKMTGGTGSYRYMAPEVYRREAYGKSVDVFSFALIVHEMFQGGPSNREEPPEHVADKRAYEDSRPPLSSYLYPEPVRMFECLTSSPYPSQRKALILQAFEEMLAQEP